jgi:hypothetical protein
MESRLSKRAYCETRSANFWGNGKANLAFEVRQPCLGDIEKLRTNAVRSPEKIGEKWVLPRKLTHGTAAHRAGWWGLYQNVTVVRTLGRTSTRCSRTRPFERSQRTTCTPTTINKFANSEPTTRSPSTKNVQGSFGAESSRISRFLYLRNSSSTCEGIGLANLLAR